MILIEEILGMNSIWYSSHLVLVFLSIHAQSQEAFLRQADSGGLAQGAGVRSHPGPPTLLKKGAPLVNRYNFDFCFCFTVEKQENMLGPLCVTSKNLAPFKKSYTRHCISNSSLGLFPKTFIIPEQFTM
jgi:hypothetical protein